MSRRPGGREQEEIMRTVMGMSVGMYVYAWACLGMYGYIEEYMGNYWYVWKQIPSITDQ